MNVTIAYKKNVVPSNMNNLLFAMPHYNCLEMKMRQPRDDGIVQILTCLELTHLRLQIIVMRHCEEKVVHVA
jgi:hypothetical protein